MSPFVSSDLPPGIGRAVLHTPVYMILQPIRCTATCVTTNTGKLLPHLFTLTPANRSGYFLLHYSTLTNSFPLGNMVPFVARTFLTKKFSATNRITEFNCKDNQIQRIIKIKNLTFRIQISIFMNQKVRYSLKE